MAFSFDCCAATHIGNRRKNNEDNFFIGDMLLPEEQTAMSQSGNKLVVKSSSSKGAENRLFAVSDGMGGHEFGEVASYIAMCALSEFSSSGKLSRKRTDKFAYIQSFQDMIAQTNGKILEYAAENGADENMGATLSGLIAFNDEAAPFNIGDSSTLLYEGGALRKLTIDDNEKSMRLDADAAELMSGGRLLTKYFGLPRSSGILTAAISTPVSLKPGQVFIIASDGLTDYLSIDDMTQILTEHPTDSEETVNALIDSALNAENGGRDNITIVMISVSKASRN